MHPIFCSIQDAAPYIQFYNIESVPLICPNIQGASSIEHTIYGHVLGHKGMGGCTCTQCTLAGSAPDVTSIIAELKYKYGQQEQVTVKNHTEVTPWNGQYKKTGGRGLNQFYGYPTSPLASVI